jgi:hypothetical protein
MPRIAKHFMDELVEHVEHPVPASIVGAIAFGRPSTLIGSITVNRKHHKRRSGRSVIASNWP